MWKYFFERLGHGLLVLFIVATLTFALLRMVPGGPFDAERKVSPEILANIKAKYSLDLPVWRQYLLYMGQVVQGDLGPSYKYVDRDVSDIILEAFPVSLTLGLCAVGVILVLGVPAGILSAARQNSPTDHACIFAATLGISIPNFVVGALLVLLFSYYWKLLPPALWDGPRHAIMPAIALGAGSAGYIARLTRSALIEVLGADYIRTARAKGLSESKVLLKHALTNAITPIVSVMGPLTAGLVTGSFVIEHMFSIPGMGYHFITAVTNRDYPLVMGVTLVYAALIVLANILVDLIYMKLDPRITLTGPRE